MRIVRVRFSSSVLAFDDDRVPVKYRFHNAELGFTIEVRVRERHAYVYATLEHGGATKHAGNSSGEWAHSDQELVMNISSEMFKLADELGVETHHIWPFVDQLPLHTETGVSVNEAMELAEPIKDLLSRGAPPAEVMSSLNVNRETIEFVLGTTLLPQTRRHMGPSGPFEIDTDY
jgi:hypothetical protein